MCERYVREYHSLTHNSYSAQEHRDYVELLFYNYSTSHTLYQQQQQADSSDTLSTNFSLMVSESRCNPVCYLQIYLSFNKASGVLTIDKRPRIFNWATALGVRSREQKMFRASEGGLSIKSLKWSTNIHNIIFLRLETIVLILYNIVHLLSRPTPSIALILLNSWWRWALGFVYCEPVQNA